MKKDREEEPRFLFESRLEVIESVFAYVCNRHCILNEDREDFRSWALLRLIDDDYAVLRGFRGKSRLSTYLTTVITNLARDYRIKQWGRWRASAAATRMGEVGVQLETLTSRDRYSFDEAVRILRDNFGVRDSPIELAQMAARLPVRCPRRHVEPIEEVVDPGTERQVLVGADPFHRARTTARVEAALKQAIEALDARQRLILRLRFGEGLTVAAIAKMLGANQRRLYTRIEKILGALRGFLEGEGLAAEEVLVLLGEADFEISIGLRGPIEGEIEKGSSKMADLDHGEGRKKKRRSAPGLLGSRRARRSSRRPRPGAQAGPDMLPSPRL